MKTIEDYNSTLLNEQRSYDEKFYTEKINKLTINLAAKYNFLFDICFKIYLWNNFCMKKSRIINTSLLSRLQSIYDQLNEVHIMYPVTGSRS